MPISKGRKKKKLKKVPAKKYDEIYDGGWYEVTRKGKNVFSRLKMTKQEHDQWMAQVKENLPKFYEEIKQKITRAAELVNSFDKIFVMGGIASISTQKLLTEEQEDNSDTETVMEYCQSIAMATPNNNKGKIPDNESLETLYKLLIEIRSDFSHYYTFEHIKADRPKIESDIRYKMMSESLFVRGEGYLKHIEELYHEMFSLHDEFFIKHYGFRSADIIKTFKQLESSFTLRVASPGGEPHPFLKYKLGQWKTQTEGAGKYPEDFAKQNPGVAIVNGKLMIYPLSYIGYYDQLYQIRHFNETQEKVVKALAMKFGGNEIFSAHSPYEVLNESAIFDYPIVEDEEGRFYLFSMNIASRNYFRIAMNLIRSADAAYFSRSFQSSRVKISKDNFMEKKVKELFQKMLPGVKFYNNVKYNYKSESLNLKCANAADGNYELDTLGVGPNATYLVEVKSGLLSDKAKRGAVLSLHSDLTKLIGDAVCQSFRAYSYVTETSDCYFLSEQNEVIRPLNKENVFRISISFSYVGSLVSSLSLLQQFGVIPAGAAFAWTVNVFDLMSFSELIDSELEFIDYLSKRIPLYYNEKLINIDETAMLGLYYAEGLKIDKAFKNSTHISLNSRSYSASIDNCFENGGPKPKKRK